MIVPLIILAVMFATIPVEANSSKSSKTITQKQAKQLKLTATKKPVRTSTMNNIKEKKCVTMIDNKTKKTYIVCPS